MSVFLIFSIFVYVRLHLYLYVSVRLSPINQLSGPRRSGVSAAPPLLLAARGRQSARWSAWPCCSGWSPCRSGLWSWHPGQRSKPPERPEYIACAVRQRNWEFLKKSFNFFHKTQKQWYKHCNKQWKYFNKIIKIYILENVYNDISSFMWSGLNNNCWSASKRWRYLWTPSLCLFWFGQHM